MRPQLEAQVAIELLAGDDGPTLAEDVLDGLTRPFKELPPKHFYDDRGSELFDRICRLPEYYPTRTERAILEERAEEIAARTGASELLELGAGFATKTHVLLNAMEERGALARYLPVDVAELSVRTCAERLVEEYPGLHVHGIVGDFERDLGRLPPAGGARLVAFLGGTIGNFPPGSRRRFLRTLAAALGDRGWLLLGVDLVKSPERLEAAYNDREGLTAAFNRNILHVVNRELGGDFEPDRFEHVALFDTRRRWIEMRLRAREGMRARIDAIDLEVEFATGEELRTEISAKFTPAGIERELAAAGLRLAALYTDPARLFALALVQCR